MQIDALLLERPDEALRDAVALRLADVDRCGADAEPFDLGLELPRPALRAPVVPLAEAQGDRLGPRKVAKLLSREIGGTIREGFRPARIAG